jgi:FdhD protein
LAVKTAEAAGITLVAVARTDSFEVFTHTHRVQGLARSASQDKGKIGHAA